MLRLRRSSASLQSSFAQQDNLWVAQKMVRLVPNQSDCLRFATQGSCGIARDLCSVSVAAQTTKRSWADGVRGFHLLCGPQLRPSYALGRASRQDRSKLGLRPEGMPGNGILRSLPCGDRRCGKAPASTLHRENGGKNRILARSNRASCHARSRMTIQAVLPPRDMATLSLRD